MPQARVFDGGTFWEDGPVTLYALWQRDDDTTDVLPDDVDSFSLEVYDLDDETDPDTPVWLISGVDPSGIFLVRQSGVQASQGGYNFKYQLLAGAADDAGTNWRTVGGHKYRFVVIVLSSTAADLNGARTVWEGSSLSVVGT